MTLTFHTARAADAGFLYRLTEETMRADFHSSAVGFFARLRLPATSSYLKSRHSSAPL